MYTHPAILALLSAAFFIFPLCSPIDAQIATDGTVGPAVTLSGPDYQIDNSLGKRMGANLFHSFERFSIRQNESASFTGPDDIATVISRVTGGGATRIDGLLRSEIGRADFYFINPAGVVFGENAQLDVPAAFHASTADEMRFCDGAVFSASDPNNSVLSMDNPESFGFLSPQPASITVNGSQLTFEPGTAVSLSGGDLTIRGDMENPVRLVVDGGELRLSAVGYQTDNGPVSGEIAGDGGGVFIMENAAVTVSGDGGGRLAMQADKAILSSAELSADNVGSIHSMGGVLLDVKGSLEMFPGTTISTDAYGSGDAGEIEINAFSLTLDGQGLGSPFPRISSASHSTGNAGTVELTIEDTLKMANGAQISCHAFGSGTAGSVTMEIANLLTMIDGAEISSNTFSAGNAGRVNIKTGDLIMTAAEGSFAGIISIADTDSSGTAGRVDVKATGLLEMSGRAEISSSTFSSGKAGNVRIEARELEIDGQGLKGQFSGIASIASTGAGGSVDVTAAQSLLLRDGALITGTAFGSGDAGSVTVDAPGLLEIIGGSEISSNTFASGDAGSVKINAGQLRLDGQGLENKFTTIGSITHADGHAGTVEVNAATRLEIVNKAEISTSTFGSGDAGSVRVEAQNLRIDGHGHEDQFTGVASIASTGDGGAVEVSVENMLEMVDEAQITCAAYGSGDAGSVTIDARRLVVEGSSRITTSADNASADGGDVNVNGTDYMLLRGGLITTSSNGGRGGDIVLTPENIVLDSGFIQANTSQGARGGDIYIYAEAVIPESGRVQVGGNERLTFQPETGTNVIQAAAPGGEKGNIVITAPEVDISASLAEMGGGLTEPVQLTTDPCLTGKGSGGGSLVLSGRGGIPEAPGHPSTIYFQKKRLDRLLSPDETGDSP